MSDQNYRRGDVSTINWFGTLFLASIPVVNIVFFIIWVISGKTASKRHFAAAALVWIVILLIAAIVACALWGEPIAAWLRNLNAAVPAVPTV